MNHIATLGVQIRGDAGYNHQTMVDMILNGNSLLNEYKSKIERAHRITLESALDNINNKKWYLLGYKFAAYSMFTKRG